MQKSEAVDELTPKQHLLIAELIKGTSIDAAAREVGITDRTAHYWLKHPHFRSAYRQAREALFETVLDKTMAELIKGIPDVLATLKKHMNAEDVMPSPATQLRAAELWYAKIQEQFQTKVLAEKIAELEKIMKESKTNG